MNITNKHIKKICTETFSNDQLMQVIEITASFVNPVYELLFSSGKEFILKVNNPHWPLKQKREISALKLVKEKTAIPLPEIITANYEKTIIPFDFLILEKKQGITLRESLIKKLITKKQLLSIVQQIGSFLGELHSITFDFFGDFSIKEGSNFQSTNKISSFWGETFDSWRKAFIAFCLDNLNWVDSRSFPNYRDKLKDLIYNFAEKISEPQTGCFVHSDLQPTNILIENSRITAFLDFEWAYSGSASFDFALTLNGLFYSRFPSLAISDYFDATFWSHETISEFLMRGYKEINKLPIIDQPSNLMTFIWLLYMIGSWSWTKQSSTTEELKIYKKTIDELFESICSAEL